MNLIDRVYVIYRCIYENKKTISMRCVFFLLLHISILLFSLFEFFSPLCMRFCCSIADALYPYVHSFMMPAYTKFGCLHRFLCCASTQ